MKTESTEHILSILEQLYSMPNMPENVYTIDYIVKTLFKPEQVTRELIQRVENIVKRKVNNGKTETRAA